MSKKVIYKKLKIKKVKIEDCACPKNDLKLKVERKK